MEAERLVTRPLQESQRVMVVKVVPQEGGAQAGLCVGDVAGRTR